MLIVGCGYPPSMQQIAWVDTGTGECGERRLTHRAEAEQFYRELKGKQLRVGIEDSTRAGSSAGWASSILKSG